MITNDAVDKIHRLVRSLLERNTHEKFNFGIIVIFDDEIQWISDTDFNDLEQFFVDNKHVN